MNTEEPLIYTTKGNVPVSSLRYETRWHFDDEIITFEETYFDGDEVVRRSVHKYGLKPLDVCAVQQPIS